MKDFLARLTSRKFLLAVAALATLAANNEWALFAATAAGYMAAEGVPDAVSRNAAGKVEVAKVERQSDVSNGYVDDDFDVDKSVITPGVIAPETP